MFGIISVKCKEQIYQKKNNNTELYYCSISWLISKLRIPW